MSTVPSLSSSSAARTVARVLSMTMLASTLSLPAHAGLISAQRADQESKTEVAIAPHAELQRLLSREQVVNLLNAQGISVEMARQRLAALTDEEAEQLKADIDSAPAGAGIIGAAVFVFLVLLATDVVGVTKVFPFTRPLR